MNSLKKLMIVLCFVPSILFGGVNIKNGNFYISYTDIVVPGGAGQELKITRTYNSNSTSRVSWFGRGWGSYFETFLRVSVDGSVVVHEHGSGAKTRFTPKKTIDPTSASKKILAAMRKKSSMTETTAKKKLAELKKDAAMRRAYAKKFGVTMDIPSGTILYSSTRGVQTLSVLKSGYERRYNDGKVEGFDKKGQLTFVKYKSDYRISLNYKKDATLTSIKDSDGKQLFFEWYSNKLVKSIGTTGKKKVTYKFDDKSRLIESTDINNNTYKYSYDQRHNMTQIAYSDGSTMKMKYDSKTQFVVEVANRQDRTTKYEYGNDPKKPDLHYWTTVTRAMLNGQEEKNRYEYEIGIRSDGSRYTKRLATNINGLATETIYSERHTLPKKITQGKTVTTFDYNDKGLLTKKASSTGEFVELSYHKKFNKITKVVNKDGWTEFSYNNQAHLSKAVNSDGMSVLLIHDLKGRIKRMISRQTSSKRKVAAKQKGKKEEKVLDFAYNSLGKPREIKMKNVGKINVAYNNNGTIKKVESKAGPEMALQVSQAFQSLRDIVKPSGVSLSI